MRIIQTALLTGVAAIACVGVAAMAASPKPQTHVLTVQLPDGSVEQIQYSGDIAPQVALAPGGMPVGSFAPLLGPAPANAPFALLARMSAEMDRQMADMMRNARAMPMPDFAGLGQVQQADLAKLPPGTQSYSFVSTINGGKACTRSVQITQGSDQKPRVVSQTSGDCAGQPGAAPGPAPTISPAVHERAAGKVTA
jgi:hypothetical protein